MNNNRFLFYLLISILASLVDFLKDLGNEAPLEALEFLPVVLPTTFLFILAVYYLRKLIFKTRLYKAINEKNKLYRIGFDSFLVVSKSFVFAFVAKIIAILLFWDYNEPYFFDLLFWGNFIAIFSITLFVYVLEAFLESESQKQEFKVKLAEFENEKSVAKYLALKKQLNPHFLFNSFDSLIGLIGEDPKKAEYFVEELSNVYRYSLNQSEEMVVTLKKELQLINSYLALQKIRFGESLELTTEIDFTQHDLLLPPMTLELLIENAIKHNVVEKNKPLKISIKASDNYVIVTNNYQPRANALSKNSLKIGLSNLVNQYRFIYKILPTFEIKDEVYIATIPLIEPEL
ncbi:sensor histidine kinase [Aquimarina sp. AU119]|uniref:sensor histidine kinase n=1 Tax=Aquimarina sp. AU119 TaxID=2108528 RepID=UPI0013591C6A|nr:histidine kinase [Aquimarina sp. AU119]